MSSSADEEDDESEKLFQAIQLDLKQRKAIIKQIANPKRSAILWELQDAFATITDEENNYESLLRCVSGVPDKVASAQT